MIKKWMSLMRFEPMSSCLLISRVLYLADWVNCTYCVFMYRATCIDSCTTNTTQQVTPFLTKQKIYVNIYHNIFPSCRTSMCKCMLSFVVASRWPTLVITFQPKDMAMLCRHLYHLPTGCNRCLLSRWQLEEYLNQTCTCHPISKWLVL